MLAKDIRVLDEVDTTIQSLMTQLDGLLTQRLAITSTTVRQSTSSTFRAKEPTLNLDTLDLSINESHGLRIKR